MGPLKTLLDVLLCHQYISTIVLSWQIHLSQIHLSLDSQLKAIESCPCVSIAKEGNGIQSFLLDGNLWPGRTVNNCVNTFKCDALSLQKQFLEY